MASFPLLPTLHDVGCHPPRINAPTAICQIFGMVCIFQLHLSPQEAQDGWGVFIQQVPVFSIWFWS